MGRSRVFHVLDAIRGIAALIVTQRHLSLSLGLPNSGTFLAVDLFFVLSGFVIAHAYAERLLSGEPVWRFMAVRCIRLYPLYLVGIGTGFVATLILDGPDQLATATILALLMLPPLAYPALDGPRWSLFYEMVANFIYAIAIRWMNPRNLLWIMAGSAAILVAGLRVSGTLDTGWALVQVPVGMARVGYGFFAGVLLYRLYTGAAGKQALAAWAVIACAALALSAAFVPLKAAAMLAVVLIAFPAIVWAGARVDVSGVWTRLCALLGMASYAIYVLHEPVGRLTYAGFKSAGYDLAHSRLAGVAMIAALLALCWVLDRTYDKPVRRWLNERLRAQSTAKAQPDGAIPV
ncbi:putative acyltransferase [Sphingomonas changbaiensis NBRC 104936]|uniref:Putative acyltransferase n=1 Tax=Sphingomonas changbaiensis NBRC 104936 TaxID=1219043 RepID=A0A0E9MQ68_9SPHN|nr:acyltransferase [Sphingomonas changbaiensis]GAO39643.1 putative acyltransferase [Sphingomonas changbaiensis NBRC 104936]